MAKTAKLGSSWLIALVVFFTLPALAAPADSTISGVVKNSAGKPQMGAVVEIFTSAATIPLKAFTDSQGFYSAKGLQPGTYFIKATANAFLPALRENVGLRAGAHMVVNMTLSTLVEAMEMLPTARKVKQDDDDWRWTLRSAANRPILRVLDDSPLVMVSSSDKSDDRVLKARVAFIAGSDGESFSGSDMKTAFNLEQSLFSTSSMQFRGNVGYNAGEATGTVRASYKHHFANGSAPELAFTARRLATPDSALHHAALNALALSLSDGFAMADFIDVNYGGELQTVQFRGRATAFRPFGGITAHLSRNTLLEYRYASTRPSTREEKGFDSSPADLSEANPRVSLQAGTPRIERARHNEVAISKHIGKNNLQVAYYADTYRNPVVSGVGEGDIDSGEFLPDIYAGTFTYTGSNFSTRGIRLVAQRKLADKLSATIDYSLGGSLGVQESGATLRTASFTDDYRHSLAGKLSCEVPKSHTRIISSYKWTSGRNNLTAVDAFNASAGAADPFLGIFIRQPIPGASFMPGKMEALVDVRNLLAQGYVPMIGADGRTLYLVQSARAIRGGVAFTF
jgi:hypothetical protein